ADEEVGETIGFCGLSTWTMRYIRHLPHWAFQGAALHVGWRLAGSMPSRNPEVLRRNSIKTGPAGPMWLADERIAEIVVRALLFGTNERKMYDLYAYVV